MLTIRPLLTALLLSGAALTATAQTAEPSADQLAFQKGTFQGATADKAQYNAIYQLDSDDPKLIKMTLRNISNALDDPRLKGKLQVELVAFGGGVTAFRKDQPYEAELLALKEKGVILAQCLNTMRERKITKEELWPFLSFVPSGNGELIFGRPRAGPSCIRNGTYCPLSQCTLLNLACAKTDGSSAY